jgi:hypothetical protein
MRNCHVPTGLMHRERWSQGLDGNEEWSVDDRWLTRMVAAATVGFGDSS